jgi:hypothetical protein
LPEPFGPTGLEAHLDRVDERLEPAQLDRFQVHAAREAISRRGCRRGRWTS